MSPLDAALQIATLGFPVFPCGRNKRPALRDGHGFHDATTDPDQIRVMFGQAGELVGVPTGEAVGFDVLDIDYRNGGDIWEMENAHRLPETRVHQTQSGGRHYLFRHVHGVRNSAAKIAEGIDVRGEGGYIVAPPSAGYSIISSADIAEWPDWLLELVLTRPEPPRINGHHHAIAIESRRLDGFVRSIEDRVRRAPEGGKHFALRNAALALGGIMDAAGINEEDATQRLINALPATVQDWKNAAKTIEWGLKRGREKPIELEDRRPARSIIAAPPDPDEGYWQSVLTEAAEAASHEPAPFEDGEPQPFEATPLDWDAMLGVPPREWIYGHFLIRRFISVLGAPGGTGKTAYAFAIAQAIATNRPLLGEPVHESGAVWIYNLEDHHEELWRRFHASAKHHEIGRSDLEGRIFIDSGRARPLVIAQATRNGDVVVSPLIPLIITEIRRRGIVLMIVDPFVRSHRLEENVNEQIDYAAALWSEVADKANCAILLVHHFRKGGSSGDASAFRGASALIDAARSAMTLGPMSADEARSFNIPENERWQYVRADNAKLNLAPPPNAAVWLRLSGVDIGNETTERPADFVQAIGRWHPPSAWEGLSLKLALDVLDRIQAGPEDGEQFTLTRGGRSRRWAGQVLKDEAKRSDAQAASILRAWVASEVLLSGRYFSPRQRKELDGVQVNPVKLANMRTSGSAAP